MSGMDRGELSETPKFNGGTTSDPIYIGGHAWGSIFTGSDLGSVTTLTCKAPFDGKATLDISSPGTLRTIRDTDFAQIAAISVSANDQYPIPPDVFRCDWLVLVADQNVADDTKYRVFLKG